MIVGDMLSELRGNILRDVSSLIAGTTTQLWTDDSLVQYIDNAQLRFARRTNILRDSSTPQTCQIPLIAGQTEYALDPAVLTVLSAKYSADPANLSRAGSEQLGMVVPHDFSPLGWNVNQLPNMQPGRPRSWTTDQAERVLRVYPAPSINDTAITFTGTLVGNLLTVTTPPSAPILKGMTITGVGLLPNTVITFDAQSGLGPTGTGGAGTYFVSTPPNQVTPYALSAAQAMTAGGTMFLRVSRLPLNTLTTMNLFAVPEVPAEYHLDLLEWAAFKALSNHELDSGNQSDNPQQILPSARHQANFENAVKEAIQEAKRTMFVQPRWDFQSMPGVTYAR